jgi:hypothetical protein
VSKRSRRPSEPGRSSPWSTSPSTRHDAEPAGLRERLAAPGTGVGHVAWLAESLEAETERLTRGGLRAFHAGRTGPASAVWFDGSDLGHPIEVLQRRDELGRFYDGVHRAAEGWDGSAPLRPAAEAPG